MYISAGARRMDKQLARYIKFKALVIIVAIFANAFTLYGGGGEMGYVNNGADGELIVEANQEATWSNAAGEIVCAVNFRQRSCNWSDLSVVSGDLHTDRRHEGAFEGDFSPKIVGGVAIEVNMAGLVQYDSSFRNNFWHDIRMR